jgi:hypothetical protein
MSVTPPVPTVPQMSDEPQAYEIRVRGVLDECWSSWFEGMRLSHDASGETIISGPVADQAALHGLLAKVRDLGLPLVSVIRVDGPGSTR